MQQKNNSLQQNILQELLEIKQLLGLTKKIWTVDDFCSFTGISKAYVYHLTASRKIKYYRPSGKMIFFDPEEVIDFLKQNPVETNDSLSGKAMRHLLNHK
jgi:excisionase family DNA binding protein